MRSLFFHVVQTSVDHIIFGSKYKFITLHFKQTKSERQTTDITYSFLNKMFLNLIYHIQKSKAILFLKQD